MNRFATAAGFLALTAAIVPCAQGQDAARLERMKPWTVSAALRGFYDDNWATAPSGNEPESFGLEIRPSAGLNLNFDQTDIGLNYTFSGKWYENRAEDNWDFQHELNARLDHRFSERYRVSLRDSFLISQEPQAGEIVTLAQRSEMSYLRNRAQIDFGADLTEKFGIVTGYGNTIWDYEQDGIGSYSATLDRMEHLIPLDLRYKIQPELTGLLGYQYGIVDYTGDEFLYAGGPKSDARNTDSHYIYAGVDYDITSQLSLLLRGGAQYTDYEDEKAEDGWSPYADITLSYAYRPDSKVDLGFRHARNATWLTAADPNGVPTLDQETSAVFLNLSHAITAKMTGNLLAQYQFSSYKGGAYDGDADNLWLIGLYAEYRLTVHWALELGYSYDNLDSDIPNLSYDRNRVFWGVRATF